MLLHGLDILALVMLIVSTLLMHRAGYQLGFLPENFSGLKRTRRAPWYYRLSAAESTVMGVGAFWIAIWGSGAKISFVLTFCLIGMAILANQWVLLRALMRMRVAER